MKGNPGQESHCLRPATWPSLWFRGHFQHAFYQVRPVQITRGLAPCHTVTVSHLTPERVLDVPSCHCTLIQSRVISRPSWDHIRATCSSWVTSGSWARLT